MHDERFEIGRAATARGPHGRDRKRDVRPVLARALRDLGTTHQFERRLALLAAGVEPRIVERRPARIAHGIGHPQCRPGRRGGGEIDADLDLVRRLARPVLLEPRDLTVDVALNALGVADRRVGGRDFLGDGREGGAPFGDRTRFPLVAEAGGRGVREALGEGTPRVGRGDRALQVGAFVLERLDAPVEFGQVDRRRRVRQPRVDGADGEFGAGLTLDPQR